MPSLAVNLGQIGPPAQLALRDMGDGTSALISANSSPAYSTRSDTFTSTTSGTTVNCATKPLKWFSISVAQTGTVTAWTVVLEVSLDGANFTTIATHTQASLTGILVAAVAATPALYFRARATVITLGLGTSVTATILGME